jgi:hypothetical protein
VASDTDTFCEIIEAVDVVADASHIDMTHRVVALMLRVVLV